MKVFVASALLVPLAFLAGFAPTVLVLFTLGACHG